MLCTEDGLTCSLLFVSFFVQLSKDAISKETLKIPTPVAAAKQVVADPALKYVTLGSFSWDQDDDKVKVRPPINVLIVLLLKTV